MNPLASSRNCTLPEIRTASRRKLAEGGILLTELAPGADLERDVLARMEFRPLLADEIKPMDARIFREETMGLQL